MFSINHKDFHTVQLVVLKHLLKFQHSRLLIGEDYCEEPIRKQLLLKAKSR